jgi:hypothetical protein
MQSFCAHHAPHYTAQTLCAREKRAVVLLHAFGLRSIVARWTWCATSIASAAAAGTATTTMESPAHRRLRQPLRRQRCTARPRFTRPAWPRRVNTTRATTRKRKPSKRCAARPQKVNFRGGRENSSGRGGRVTCISTNMVVCKRNLLAGFLAQPRPPGASLESRH